MLSCNWMYLAKNLVVVELDRPLHSGSLYSHIPDSKFSVITIRCTSFYKVKMMLYHNIFIQLVGRRSYLDLLNVCVIEIFKQANGASKDLTVNGVINHITRTPTEHDYASTIVATITRRLIKVSFRLSRRTLPPPKKTFDVLPCICSK